MTARDIVPILLVLTGFSSLSIFVHWAGGRVPRTDFLVNFILQYTTMVVGAALILTHSL